MRYVTRVLLPFILFVYIAVETYLKLNHASMCEAQGCKLAGELLRFSPIYLNFLGMAAAVALSIAGYASLRSKFGDLLFRAFAYGALAFETVMLSYQYVVNPELCIFCLGVWAILLLIVALNDLHKLATIGAIVVAIVTALLSLAIPQNSVGLLAEGNYLIYSDRCPHCKKVKRYLAEHPDITYTPIAVTDTSARFAMKYLGINTIPIWIEKSPSRRIITIGDTAIIKHLEEKHTPQTHTPPADSMQAPLPGSDFLQAGGEEGCVLSIMPQPACDENGSVP